LQRLVLHVPLQKVDKA